MPILIKETIDKYGYHPFKISLTNAKKLVTKCDLCKMIYEIKNVNYHKSPRRKIDNKTFCKKCSVVRLHDLNFKDLTGKRFGKLLVLNYSHLDKNASHSYWNCLCDCGVKKIVRGQYLNRSTTKSCGCDLGYIYVESARRKTKPLEVTALSAIKFDLNKRNKKRGFVSTDLSDKEILEIVSQPCFAMGCGITNDRNIRIRRRGGDVFYRCNSIDRIDNSKGYSKGNVRSSCIRHNIDRNNKTVEEYDEKLSERAIKVVLSQYKDKLSTRTKNELKKLLNET